jgi:hypothetical protein
LTKLALNDRLRKKLYNILYNNPADDPYAEGLVLDLNMTTGLGYSDLSITSSSAVGLVKGHDGLWVAKPAGYLAGLEGARVNGSAPAWDNGSGNALSGVVWRGPKAATTTLNAWSKPTPGTNSWVAASVTDGGDVPGPDGNATSARRLVFSSGGQVFRNIISTAVAGYATVLIKGTAGDKINLYFGSFTDSYSCQFTLTGGWDCLSKLLSLSGTPVGSILSLNTVSSTIYGGLNPTPAPTVDVFMLQVSTAPDAYIPTTGTNLTRLAETVSFPRAIGADWTAVVGADLSGGLPISAQTVIGTNVADCDPLWINASGDVGADVSGGLVYSSDTPNATTGTSKVGMRKAGNVWTAKADGTIGNNVTISAPPAHASLRIGGSGDTEYSNVRFPISTVKIWDRALTDGLFTDA